MTNALLLIATLVGLYSGVLIFYRLFGRTGLYCWVAIAAIVANIEVMILIHAFGMDQTLGNVMFASTFLVTDILSEADGKKTANHAVGVGIATSLVFLVVSQSWLMFIPAADDTAMPAMREIFSNTPRILLAGFMTYAVVQYFDVWLYHKLWDLTANRTGKSRPYLWFRNNVSTLTSQAINTVLFTLGAFYGKYDAKVLISIMLSSYAIFIVTTLADTPVVYIARRMNERRKINVA